MVLYTPLSVEDIFPTKQAEEQIVSYSGRQVCVKKNEAGQLELVRLLSTNPDDFLRTSLAPGTIVANDSIQK